MTSNPSLRGPAFGLCAAVAVNNQLRDGARQAGQPFIVDVDEVMRIAAQISPDVSNPLSVRVKPELVHQIAMQLNQPILYIDVGNRFSSYGPGPIDIIKCVILAQPEEFNEDLPNGDDGENVDRFPVILQRKTWLRDHKALDIIRKCGPNTTIVCYNSHLNRTLFTAPIPITTTGNMTKDAQRHIEAVILKIGKIDRQRVIRNVVLVAGTVGGIYFSTKLLALITAGSATSFLASIKKTIADWGEKIFGSSTPDTPTGEGASNPPPSQENTGGNDKGSSGEGSSNPPSESSNPPPSQENTGGNPPDSQNPAATGPTGEGSSNPPSESSNPPPPQENTGGNATGPTGEGSSNPPPETSTALVDPTA